METKITSPMMDDLIDNITPEGTATALIDCDKCRYNRSMRPLRKRCPSNHPLQLISAQRTMTRKEISDMYEVARFYCFKRITHNAIRKRIWKKAEALTEYPGVIFEKVNIPNVGDSFCEYTLYSKPKAGAPYNINVDFHRDGILYRCSSTCYSGDSKDGAVLSRGGRFFIAIHPHAIDRFIERHRFKGTFQEAEEYILQNYKQVSYKIDMTTSEIICPFDSGAFLGKEDEEGIVHLKTFVMNRQLFLNQRLDEVKAKQFEKNVMRGI